MKTTHFKAFITCLTLILIFGCTPKEKPKKKYNVLFVSIDDLKPTLGVYGDTIVHSPNIDALAAEGITFREAFCQAAVCAPSRASLMTGVRPDSTRVWHLGDKFREINPNAVTMPQYFSKHGYHTVNIGKIFHNYMPDSVSWDEPDLRPSRYLKKDWLKRDGETFYISPKVNASQALKRDSLLKLRPVRYADGWNTGPAWEAADVHDTLYYDGAQNELAKKTLTRLAKMDKPFYMGLGYFRPHLPFAVPKKYWDLYDPKNIPLANNPNIPKNAPLQSMNSMYELRHYDGFSYLPKPTQPYEMPLDTIQKLRQGYYASVSYIDALLGQLVEYMKQIGIYDNTIIVVWGDHGWKLGDHNSWGKMTNYNIDLKVPVIIRHPEQKNKGISSYAITELVDLFPTLCELVDIEVPNYMQGTSLVPLFENPEQDWKSAAFSQFHRRPKVSADGKRYMGYSINTAKYHYIEWYSWNAKKGIRGELKDIELYDRVKDPYETINIAVGDSLNQIKQELSAQMVNGWVSALPK
ncbi:sulfatase [Croceitalea rosinachiae]|uniref:Sulfatase n=1 Tax=Croceitalea rosinachiae TaxID=3075596 RepID=A0ABU3A780_9FLAO|nr:sulfatase [Croceitalea sp. F388]MDT0606025.1 sulfatase [Croceitalea sp. F388]